MVEDSYITIGRVINSVPEYQARLVRNALFRHILITGTTGSGKSYTASIITDRVSRELAIPSIILDWHSEYESLLPNYVVIDPFEAPLQLFTGDPNDLSVISSVLELTPPQEYILEKILKRMDLSRLKALDTLLEYIEEYPEESNWIRESKLALHRKLSFLTRERYYSLFKPYDSSFSILNKIGISSPSIVDLGKIVDTTIRKLYSAFFLKRLVDSAISVKKPILVVIEESQHYLPRSQFIKPICEMLREVRKFNIGLVVISQSIQQLVEDVPTNTNTKIIHAVKSKQDLDLVEKSLYLNQDLITILPYLEPGEAVYSTPTFKKPILIKIE